MNLILYYFGRTIRFKKSNNLINKNNNDNEKEIIENYIKATKKIIGIYLIIL